MKNVTSFFDKKKNELSNNSNDGQDTKKQREASSLELPFEKASDGDVFKNSLKSEDCILILKRCMENIEKKMEELCTATKNTKESQIKSELQLVSMNKTKKSLLVKNSMNLKKIDVKKTKLLKICQKKHLKWLKGLTN